MILVMPYLLWDVKGSSGGEWVNARNQLYGDLSGHRLEKHYMNAFRYVLLCIHFQNHIIYIRVGCFAKVSFQNKIRLD